MWTDHVTTSVENQSIAIFPTNPITSKLYYTHAISNKNQRIVMSGVSDRPIVWKISKVDSTQPLGIQKITLYQDVWNNHTDYIDKDEFLPNGNKDIFAMYADYYQSSIDPTDPTEPTPTPSSNSAKITASTSTIKIGGSYKTLSVSVVDENGVDITDTYSEADIKWACEINGIDYTDNTDVITWLNSNTFNKQKIKFCNDRSYLQKILEVKCIVTKDEEVIETDMRFELIV